jgi:hypothetical protein
MPSAAPHELSRLLCQEFDNYRFGYRASITKFIVLYTIIKSCLALLVKKVKIIWNNVTKVIFISQ